MFQAKDLSEDQVAKLHEWAAEGDQLADLQKRLKEEFSLNVTYMDMRFVALDLGVEIVSPEEEAKPEEPETTASEANVGPPPVIPVGPVAVTVDQIATPGAMVSGRVRFSDGEAGRWMIDEMGRPSLDPDTANYQPTHEDLVAFQGELRKALEQDNTLGL